MFPDFSQMGKGIDALNEKFDRIIALLEIIADNTAPVAPAQLDEESRHE